MFVQARVASGREETKQRKEKAAGSAAETASTEAKKRKTEGSPAARHRGGGKYERQVRHLRDI